MKSATVVLFLLFSLNCKSQNTSNFIFFGYQRSNLNTFDVGLKFGTREFGEFDRNFLSITADAQFGKSLWAPSIGANFYGRFYFIALKAKSFQFKGTNDVRVCPEVGLSYFGFVNIGYSYYIPINSKEMHTGIGRNFIDVTLSLPFPNLW